MWKGRGKDKFGMKTEAHLTNHVMGWKSVLWDTRDNKGAQGKHKGHTRGDTRGSHRDTRRHPRDTEGQARTNKGIRGTHKVEETQGA